MGDQLMISEIQNFYFGRSIFLTGVSGYLGKALLEKLLRSCPGIAQVYVLLRPKRGVDVQSRLYSIFESPIFDILKREDKTLLLDKVHAIAGDITLPGLGINEQDSSKIRNCSVVIHSAASVKFNERLKDALEMNYYGTKRVLDLCRELKHVAAFVHISTAYSNSDLREIPEKIVSLKFPQNIDLMSEEEIHRVTPLLVGRKPNTYTYTKALAEVLLEEQREHLPVCIVRPSIVCSAWQEPQPGFVDSLNGLTGAVAAAGKGILPSMYADESKIVDLIPLDVVVNVILAAGWSAYTHRKESIPVYNVCSGSINPFYIKDVRKYGLQAARDTPANDVFRYPDFLCTTSPILNRTLRFFMTFIPFLIMDVFGLIIGRKPRMVRLYNKLAVAADSLDFFTNNEFQFTTDNMGELRKKMGENDKRLFYWNIEDLNWEHYFRNYFLGIKSYIFKEDSSTLKSARERMSRMYWVHKVIPLLILFLTWAFVIYFCMDRAITPHV